MRALLDGQLFVPPAQTPMLLSIFMLGSLGRHRVVVDTADSAYQGWYDALDPSSQEICSYVVEWSLLEEALGRASHEIHIVRSAASTRSPTALTLDDALDLLSRPCRLLMEHSRADGDFLMCMATPDERQFLEKRIEREWLEIETCGGITGVEMRAIKLGQRPQDGSRCSAMFDSDALQPGVPSGQAMAVVTACNPSLHHHMLARRAIENYLPLEIHRWCDEASGNLARQRKNKMRAFTRLSRSQRHHFHMKGGFEKDEKRVDKRKKQSIAQNPLFSNLNEHDRGKLHKGFGNKIAQRFADVSEHELRRDGGWLELRPFIEQLIQRVK